MSATETILEYLAKIFAIFFGSANERELRRLWPLVEEVNRHWPAIRSLSDEQIMAKTAEFRRRLLRGESEDNILPEAFAVCREAAHRTLGKGQMVAARYDSLVFENGKFVYKPVPERIPLFAHFDVQILGGIVLHHGKIAEMVTGEGKTLVATLPAYLNALRVTDEWAEMARRLQGPESDNWTFKPYGLYIDERGGEWRTIDRLPPPPDDPTWKMPARIIPVSRGVHIVTVNDYLAQRDADYNRPLFSFLGLTVGAIQAHMDSQTRIPIYACDITYGTNNEFGFDYLRDNLKVTREDQVQRSRFFAIVDEVDSVLIDEARTPLIISGSTRESTDKYYLADRVARQLKGGDMNAVEDRIEAFMKQGMQREEARLRAEEDFDYVYSERDHSAKLTERGMHKVLRLLGMMDIYSGENLDMPHFIDNALRAHALYKRDHHYVVENDQVIIVDEFTGRKMEGRRWSDGLHQAVEAKEHLKIKEESQTVATITFQNFFRLYKKLAGMTGTAMTEAKEFDYIYKLGVVSIPTNRPLRRINYPDLVYGTLKEKYEALVEHVVETHKTGRPMLIGTVSIERSELISNLLKRRGVPHEVLNAKHHAREAQIVAMAGRLGQVTVATNMAGRGTDIVLQEFTLAELLAHWQKWGLAPKASIAADMPMERLQEILRRHWVQVYLPEAEEKYETKPAAEWDRLLKQRWEEMGIVGPVLTTRVAEMGGLHIVGSERHEARRIDNQLRGRAGRQGDPGSSRFFLSLEDDMMRQFAPDKVKRFMQWAGLKDGVPIESPLVSRSIENAQRKVEERNFEIRKNLLEYDQVMNEQRLIVYERRQRWLEGQGLRESAFEFCENYIAKKVQEATAVHISEWDIASLCRMMRDAFGVEIAPGEIEERKRLPDPVAAIENVFCERLAAAYARREAEIGAENMRLIERLVMLSILDRRWMDHLYEMDLLKESIHLEGYAGRDPKIRYKIEGYSYFQEMWNGLEAEVAETILKVNLRLPPAEEGQPAAPPPQLRERVAIKAAIHAEYEAAAAEAESKSAVAAESRPQPIRKSGPRVKPNDLCPCKSGKKYKKCCGR